MLEKRRKGTGRKEKRERRRNTSRDRETKKRTPVGH